METLEHRQAEFAKQFDLTYEQYKLLSKSVTYDQLISCLELLRCKGHRSQYRASMASKIRSWIDNPVGLKPLSGKEFSFVLPRWPVHFQIPTQ